MNLNSFFLRNNSVIIIFLLFPFFLNGKTPVVQSAFITVPVTVDGVLDEWEGSFRQDKTGLEYLILNDTANLYIGIKVYDQAIRNKIRRFGFTVWIDPSGRGKKKFRINYPVKISRRMGSSNGQNKQMGEEVLNTVAYSLPQRDSSMILSGFEPEKQKVFTTINSEPGILVSMQNDRFKGFTYELALSLKKLKVDGRTFLEDPEKYISLIFETGYLHTTSQAGGGPGMRSGGGMPVGRPSMGGRGGGVRSGGGRQNSAGRSPEERMKMMQEMTSPTHLLLKHVHLAPVSHLSPSSSRFGRARWQPPPATIFGKPTVVEEPSVC